MTPGKRFFDIAFALVLLPFLAPVAVLVALAVLLCDGRPVLHVGERIGEGGRPFGLIKFRTMRPGTADALATGGHKAARISPLGGILRRTRLDELPQLVHILDGQMSFVGPRPPLRRYVMLHPGLYARVLRSRPGVTGLATLRCHRDEARLMAGCGTAEESDRVYRARCLPRKARLDLFYARNRSLRLDLWIICATVRAVFLPRAGRT